MPGELRTAGAVAAAAVAAAAALALTGAQEPSPDRGRSPVSGVSGSPEASGPSGASRASEPSGPSGREGAVPAPLPRSAPVDLSIDTIGVRARLLELGLRDDGSLEDPPLEDSGAAGWYALGPSPGEAGPAVITGHRDTAEGPSVFVRLEELRPGDRFTVAREDGSAPEFEVERTQRADKDGFPTERVYGPTPYPEIRLITCAGAFDSVTGHYEENLIVFGRMVD
ncbi:class F sortase [Nocardiopsis suaedae]|uniref:Class F sortase n=1 Tax=Nocardiopsis suaedae TaxID=3018444 RepID=A0ABT4TEH4_9ACTN|nr:class F sortase [Nocardiopsis suaedae]MDA2803103.1 class F sortase [Nocardiopsis suaedae]